MCKKSWREQSYVSGTASSQRSKMVPPGKWPTTTTNYLHIGPFPASMSLSSMLVTMHTTMWALVSKNGYQLKTLMYTLEILRCPFHPDLLHSHHCTRHHHFTFLPSPHSLAPMDLQSLAPCPLNFCYLCSTLFVGELAVFVTGQIWSERGSGALPFMIEVLLLCRAGRLCTKIE